jgi:hypothetical protein
MGPFATRKKFVLSDVSCMFRCVTEDPDIRRPGKMIATLPPCSFQTLGLLLILEFNVVQGLAVRAVDGYLLFVRGAGSSTNFCHQRCSLIDDVYAYAFSDRDSQLRPTDREENIVNFLGSEVQRTPGASARGISEQTPGRRLARRQR